jgi:hypothetical protein
MMTSMYAMLFNDDKFEAEDSLVFNWNPVYWGFGPEKFSYTRSTLQDAIIAESERNGWIGVCCEPNMVFIACNQFPVSFFDISVAPPDKLLVDWDAVQRRPQRHKHR